MIARSIRGSAPGGLQRYLLDPARQLPLESVRTRNLISVETAAREIEIAAQRSRAQKIVQHLILAWHPEETPSGEQMFAAAERFLTYLRVTDHQCLMVIHGPRPGEERQNRHHEIHLMLGRVGPTGKVPKSLLRNDWQAAERAAAKVACEFGFRVIKGRWNTIAHRQPETGVLEPPVVSGSHKRDQSQGMRGLRARTGHISIVDHIRSDGQLIRQLTEARRSGDWSALLKVINTAGYGLGYSNKARVARNGKQLAPGLVLFDRSDPKRRQAFSDLGRTSDDKWGYPSLVSGVRVRSRIVWPPMGPPPPNLITFAPTVLGIGTEQKSLCNLQGAAGTMFSVSASEQRLEQELRRQYYRERNRIKNANRERSERRSRLREMHEQQRIALKERQRQQLNDLRRSLLALLGHSQIAQRIVRAIIKHVREHQWNKLRAHHKSERSQIGRADRLPNFQDWSENKRNQDRTCSTFEHRPGDATPPLQSPQPRTRRQLRPDVQCQGSNTHYDPSLKRQQTNANLGSSNSCNQPTSNAAALTKGAAKIPSITDSLYRQPAIRLDFPPKRSSGRSI